MYVLSILLLPCVASYGLKAVSYGVHTPVETLFPRAVPATNIPATHNNSGTSDMSQNVRPPQPASEPWGNSVSTTHGSTNENAEELEDDEDEFDDYTGENDTDGTSKNGKETEEDHVVHEDQYVPVGNAGDRTLVHHAGGLEKRTTHRDTTQINCLDAVEICQNVGYYQNCMRGADGRSDVVLYYNGPSGKTGQGPTTAEIKNRVLSGVSTNWGTPCRSWPFGQKFHDQYPFRKGGNVKKGEKYVETDEWPMASMQIPGADRSVSLRCMTHTANDKGAKAWQNFRRGEGPYNPNAVIPKGKPPNPDLSGHRLQNAGDKISIGDDFFVNLNMDAFDAVGTNSDHDKIRR